MQIGKVFYRSMQAAREPNTVRGQIPMWSALCGIADARRAATKVGLAHARSTSRSAAHLPVAIIEPVCITYPTCSQSESWCPFLYREFPRVLGTDNFPLYLVFNHKPCPRNDLSRLWPRSRSGLPPRAPSRPLPQAHRRCVRLRRAHRNSAPVARHIPRTAAPFRKSETGGASA
jgi:hypothetical protein